LEPDNEQTIEQLKTQRLTNGKEAVIIRVTSYGLVCIPRGILLPSKKRQPVSQGLFRISKGVAYIKNRFFKTEFPFGFIDSEKDKEQQDYLVLRIPVEFEE